MTVASLPDRTPTRVAGTGDPTSADPSSAEAPPRKDFAAALDARVAQRERDERHPRRSSTARPPEGAIPQPPPPAEHAPPELPSLETGPVPQGATAGARAEASWSAATGAPPAATPAVPDESTAPSDTHSLQGARAPGPVPTAVAASLPIAPRGALPAAASAGEKPRSRPAAVGRAEGLDLALASRLAADASLPAGLALTTGSSKVGDVDPSAKTVTAVNRPSSGSLTIADPARSRLRDALSFVANQAALRRGAVGELDVPELGRVVIRAEKGTGGAVDVHIEADRAETRGVLHASAAAMAADLREADVPLGQIQIDMVVAGSASGGRGAPGDDIRRERASARRGDKENAPSDTRPKRRVRIVL